MTTSLQTSSTSQSSTAPAKKDSLIVLNRGHWNWKPPMLIKTGEKQLELKKECFDWDYNTDARWTCSITWQNQFYVFGGWNVKRQISRVTNRGIKIVGQLRMRL